MVVEQAKKPTMLAEALEAHRRFVHKVHTTKFILTGWRLRAAQAFYVSATFIGCLGTLKYFTPPQEEIIANLGRRPQPKTAQLRELEQALADVSVCGGRALSQQILASSSHPTNRAAHSPS
jgi:hypothetical protein|eukprot:SAG25_NODE_485_length_7477_cov_6.546761_4_plen_121_part_00